VCPGHQRVIGLCAAQAWPGRTAWARCRPMHSAGQYAWAGPMCSRGQAFKPKTSIASFKLVDIVRFQLHCV